MIDRPTIVCDDDHKYTLDGEPVPGVSTVAKIGSDTFTPGAWWGWGMAVEGLVELAGDHGLAPLASVEGARSALRDEGIDPNQQRDRAGKRGNAVHHALELLAQEGKVPDPADYPAEQRGHVLSLVRWYLHYRPEFEATEVMVGSREHGFAGRYDLRVLLDPTRFGNGIMPVPGVSDLTAGRIRAVVDLKTSKSVYPEQHFAQLGGYEVGNREMGFRPADALFVLRTRPDGGFTPWERVTPRTWEEANFVPAWGDPQQLFLGYLAAYKARAAMEWDDPAAVARRADAQRRREEENGVEALLLSCPLTARKLAEDLAVEPKTVQNALQRLKGQGRVRCEGRTWHVTMSS